MRLCFAFSYFSPRSNSYNRATLLANAGANSPESNSHIYPTLSANARSNDLSSNRGDSCPLTPDDHPSPIPPAGHPCGKGYRH